MSNPHNGFHMLPFYDYGFKQAARSTRELMTLRDDHNVKFELPVTSQRNGLDYVNVSFVKPETHIPSSFNMVHINDTLAAHERSMHV